MYAPWLRREAKYNVSGNKSTAAASRNKPARRWPTASCGMATSGPCSGAAYAGRRRGHHGIVARLCVAEIVRAKPGRPAPSHQWPMAGGNVWPKQAAQASNSRSRRARAAARVATHRPALACRSARNRTPCDSSCRHHGRRHSAAR